MRVRLYARFRELSGGRERQVDVEPSASVRQAVAALIRQVPDLGPELFDEQGNLLPFVGAFLNGRDVRHLDGGLDTPLRNGDELALFPPVAGGRR